MQNEAQYDLEKKAAKITALSSNDLDKYEYLTAEDLGLKPSTIEQTKFEYSPLGKVFNKGLSEDDEKEGLFKRLRNIEGKNEAQLKAIKNINISSKLLKTIGCFSTLSDKARRLMANIKQIDEWLDTAQLVCRKTHGKTKDKFSNFTFPSKFASKMYDKNLTLQVAEDNQQELETLLNNLNKDCNPKNKIKTKEKEDILKSARRLSFIREEIIRAFKRAIFPYTDGFKVEKESDEKIDTTDIPDLESAESAKRKNQNASRLKLLTPD